MVSRAAVSAVSVLAAAAAAGAASAAVADAGPAAARPAAGGMRPLRVMPTCSRLAGARVVYRSRSNQVVVRRATVRGDGGPHDWACSSANTSYAWLLGNSAGGVPPDETFDAFGSAGSWLVVHESSESGWSACPGSRRTRVPGCRHHHQIEVVDVAGGVATSTPSGADVRIRLSAIRTRRGSRVAAIAWTQPASRGRVSLSTLLVREPVSGSGTVKTVIGGAHRVAVGRIDVRSVRLSGLRLAYRVAGRRRHTVVR